jgi:diguanylate cyclase (GGDEF)-like protein
VESPPDGLGGRDARSGPLRHLSRHTSVWYYLVALALLPSVGVAVITGLVAADRLDEMRDADRVERAVTALRSLDGLRLALDAEATSSVLEDALAEYGTTPDVVNREAGAEVSVPLPQARRATDDAVDDVRRNGTPVTADAVEQVAQRVTELRAVVDQQRTTQRLEPVDRRERAWRVATGFGAVGAELARLERASVDAVTSGRYGPGGPALLGAVAELEAVTRLAVLGGERSGIVFRLHVAPPAAVPGLVAELRDADAAFRHTADEQSEALAGGMRTAWQVFMTGHTTVEFDELVAGIIAAPPVTTVPEIAPAAAVTQLVAATQWVAAWSQGAALVQLAATDGVTAAANADRDTALDRARAAAIIVAVVLSLTLLALAVIGGTIRWRLRDLAEAARGVRTGQLHPVDVRGPSEIADAGEDLNDAVRNLSRVTSAAERLAAGDLTAPDLLATPPGPLGTAVQATASRVADTVRERDRLERALTHLATHDELTGLVNRVEGERLITAALERSREEGTRIGLLFVDLDRFQRVNDLHGLHAGDHVLQVAAARLEAQVRGRDVVCRFGGDEFVVLLDPVESEFAAIDIGERVVASVGEPILFDGQELFVAASVGAATVVSGSMSLEELLGRSDSAVYRAKASGRGGVVAH